jgi:hypothetical protein
MIDLMKPGQTVGSGCYFKNGSPTNPELWPYFKGLKGRLRSELMNANFVRANATLAITLDIVERCFNPVLDSLTDAVLRDADAQFRYYCADQGLDVRFDDEKRTFFLNLKPGTPFYD